MPDPNSPNPSDPDPLIITVTDNSTATYASVARDGDGDFVVTWSQKDDTDADGTPDDWNVYARRFTALGDDPTEGPIGAFRVNGETEGDQCFSTVAMDVEGKFVITWQSRDQDGSGWGVYAKQFDRDGEVVGVTNGTQLLSFNGVALAVYELEYEHPTDGSMTTRPIGYNRGDLVQSVKNIVDAFAVLGVSVTAEAVSATNISITFTGDDGAMDQEPILVGAVNYLNTGEPWREITAQTLADGGSGEIKVNVQTENDQRFPAVAMNSTGDFVITWTATGLGNDTGTEDTDVRARAFQWTIDDKGESGYQGGSEFLVNETTIGSQKWSSIAMDASGDFVISWTDSPENPADIGYTVGLDGEQDIYARRYVWDGASLSPTAVLFQEEIDPGDPNADPVIPPTYDTHSEFVVNSFLDHTQQHSQVAMDVDGDFIVTWQSFQDRPSLIDDPDSFGVYAQAFARNEDLGSAGLGVEGQIEAEFRVNASQDDDQIFPGVAMDDAGDYMVVWETNTGTSRTLVRRRFPQLTDDAGPMVTEVRHGSNVVDEEEVLDDDVYQMVVTFGEELLALGRDGQFSIENPDNWKITRSGQEMHGSIIRVDFYRDPITKEPVKNPLTGKYEAVVFFDAEPGASGIQPLGDGRYELTVKSNARDLFGNALDGDFNGYQDDAGFTRTFIIRGGGGGGEDNPVPSLPGVINGRTFPETPGAVAVDGDGDHIVVWTAYDQALGLDRVYAAMYDADGDLATLPDSKYPIFAVTEDPSFDADTQRYASVACDADGDFVVTWTNYRDGDADVYARRFSSAGEALGPAFRLNTYTEIHSSGRTWPWMRAATSL